MVGEKVTEREILFNKILDISISDNKEIIYTHLIEEMSELTQDICRLQRGKNVNIFHELSDVYFQIRKLLRLHGLSENFLIDLAIEKTEDRFPYQWDIVKNYTCSEIDCDNNSGGCCVADSCVMNEEIKENERD